MNAAQRADFTRAPLARHALVWPVASAHAGLRAQAVDLSARSALDDWLAQRWPFVVRRADDALAPAEVAIGLPLPPDRGKRRLAFTLPRHDVAQHRRPPTLHGVAAALEAPWRSPLAALDRDARAIGVTLRAFGSAAWQVLTTLPYLTDKSDLDVLFTPSSAATLDAVTAVFERWEHATGLRVDAEIHFAGGQAVAWREWTRSIPASRVLAKAIDGARLVSRDALAGRLAAASP